MKKLLSLILVVLLISGCATEAQNIKPTVSTYLTITPSPSKTKTPFPTFIDTQIATLTSNPVFLTQEAVVATCVAPERKWFTKYLSTTYYTHGNWEAIVCSDNGAYTRVWNSFLDISWALSSYSNVSEVNEIEWYWEPYLWSLDGRYLYLTAECLCSIDSPWLLYASGFGLSRLDLGTGQLSVWLIPSASPWYTFAFTEDSNYFAFSPNELPNTIKIRELESGGEQNLSFKQKYSILQYRFTPDTSRLIVFSKEREGVQGKNGFSVFVYHTHTGMLRKVMDAEKLSSILPIEEYIEPRIFISELSDDVLYLSDIYGDYSFELNIRTGELITKVR